VILTLFLVNLTTSQHSIIFHVHHHYCVEIYGTGGARIVEAEVEASSSTTETKVEAEVSSSSSSAPSVDTKIKKSLFGKRTKGKKDVRARVKQGLEEQQEDEVAPEEEEVEQVINDEQLARHVKEAAPYIRSMLLQETNAVTLIHFWEESHLHLGISEAGVLFARLHQLLSPPYPDKVQRQVISSIMMMKPFGMTLANCLIASFIEY
jgi:hypothetical protein